MSKTCVLKLADELRPNIEGKETTMRSPVDVVKQVALTLYYLSDEGSLRKTANAFGVSRQVTLKIIRKVCKAISIHLGNKYIHLPKTENFRIRVDGQILFEYTTKKKISEKKKFRIRVDMAKNLRL